MATELEALQRAVDIAKGQSGLAGLLSKPDRKIAQAHVWYWLRKMKKAPHEHVLEIEALTGVSRHDLRPDLYPREAPPAEAAA